MTNNSPGFDALMAANPVTDESLDQLQQRRKNNNLKKITGISSSNSLKVAAVVGALALAGLSLPLLSNQPAVASADEVLTQAADASLSKQALGATSVGYIQREDTSEDGSISSVYKVDAGGAGTTDSTVSGDPKFTLPALTDPAALVAADTVDKLNELAGDDTTRGALNLLLNPYLNGQQQKMIYELLRSQDGNVVTDEGEDHVTITQGDISYTLIPSTGQLASAHNLVADGVTTEVAATAILGCVNVEGLQGPDTIATACADNNYTVHDITWQSWGDESAVGHGTAWINDCDPFCADGTFHTHPVTVTVSEKQKCGYQADVYSKLELTYDDAALNESFSIGCE